MQLLESDLDREVPGLLTGVAVVALVPATQLRGWAAEMAWRLARAAAAGGRRTVLVDCFVDAPTLHGAEGAPDDEGLVDAFEYGASLNRIVQQQPQADLFFIPAGTWTPDAEPVLQNPRWRRLSAGFRHEEALLLLYVGAEHLATIPADPDGIIVLAPQGQALAVAEAPELTEAIAKGLPLLAVVADEQTVGASSGDEPGAAPAAAVVAAPADAPITPEEARHARVGLIVATLFIVVLGLGTAVRFGALSLLRRPDAGRARAARATAAPASTPPAPAASRATRDSTPPPAAATAAGVAHPVEPLPWTLEIAVVPSLTRALAMADSLEAHGAATMVVPGRVPGRAVYYRVQLGPFSSPARADSARAAAVRDGLLARGAGTLTSAPLSLELPGRLSRGGAVNERARLRRAGVPAFVLGQSDGSYRLYAGAFARAVPESLLDDLFTPTGGVGEIVPRAGYLP